MYNLWWFISSFCIRKPTESQFSSRTTARVLSPVCKDVSRFCTFGFWLQARIWSIPGVTLHLHASHSKCQHHDTIIVWKSRAPVCSTHKLYSFVEPCFPGNAWPCHQPRPYERTQQNTSLISRVIWDAYQPVIRLRLAASLNTLCSSVK